MMRLIKKEQASSKPAIRKKPFRRVVDDALCKALADRRRPANDFFRLLPSRISPKAVMALQEASEAFAIERLSDAARVASRQKRKAPTDEDMRLVRDLKPMEWEKKSELLRARDILL